MISSLIPCDLHRIEAADPHPWDCDETVRRNVREQDDDARPAIKGRLPSLDGYGTVLLGSPIWNVRAPMIMTTFCEQLDFRGRTVVPFTTHAMSGLGTTARDHARSASARRSPRASQCAAKKSPTPIPTSGPGFACADSSARNEVPPRMARSDPAGVGCRSSDGAAEP
ncbi:flavodoxin [Streptomyces sp. NPDC048558]|uniref:flavodoxin n=1 Tax=Streptomyces sp. NPDC048558 TaxID=3155759 RepID=UPI0033E45B5C